MVITQDNGHYHYHDIYPHAPNEDDDDNSRTDITSCDDREIVATITTNITIIFLYTTVAHPMMAPIILLLLKIILSTALLTSMAHPTMAA